MKLKLVLAGLALVVIAYSVGRFTTPAEVQIKEVEQIVYVERETKERDQNVTEKETETRYPDGTVVKEKIKTKETKTVTEKETESSKTKLTESKTESRPSYRVGLGSQVDIKDFREIHYTLMIERRLFSELYLGGMYSTNQTIGIILTLGF